jgi:hypothetical protein
MRINKTCSTKTTFGNLPWHKINIEWGGGGGGGGEWGLKKRNMILKTSLNQLCSR